MPIETKGDSIKYVTIELLMKDAIETAQVWQDQKEKVVYGVLKGIASKESEKSSEKFILVGVPDKSSKACNLEIFNILSFEIYDGTERDITFFRADKEDQKAAFGMVEEIIKILKEAKRTSNGGELIDINSFSDLPKDFSSEKDGKVTSPSTNFGTGKTATAGYVNNNAHSSVYHNTGYTYTTPPKEKEVTVLKRTSRKPTQAMLDKMKEAVLSIAAGTYETKLPKIKNDEKEKDDKTEDHTPGVKVYSYDDEDYGYCCG
jgi:hypothetical protein